MYKDSETITRGIPFPKRLKEHLEKTRRLERRSFVAEVIYRLEKQVEQEQSQQESRQ